MRELTFLIYIVLWEGFVLGGTAYLVFWRDASGWWFLLACILSSASFQPETWIHGRLKGDTT